MDLSKFTKKTLIEQGIFSQVFKVIENDTENIYSAKISLTELNETQKRLIMGLKREINVIYRLNRRSVLRFIGYIPYNFQQKSHPVFITEYASNGSLYDIIKSERKFIPPTSWNDSKKLISVFLTKAAVATKKSSHSSWKRATAKQSSMILFQLIQTGKRH